MRGIKTICVIAFLLILPAGVWAADDASVIAPYIDANTVLVMRVDPAAINLDATQISALNAIKAGTEPGVLKTNVIKNLPRSVSDAKRWTAEFKKAGGTTVYLSLNAADMDLGPVFVVPLKEGADGKALVNLMTSGFSDKQSKPERGDLAATVDGNCVLAGEQKLLDNLKTRRATPRPEFAAILSSAGDAPMCVAFIPDEKLRQSMVDAMPVLPPEMGSVHTADLIGALTSASAALSTEPKIGLRAEYQYKDADSAAAAIKASTAMKEAMVKSKEEPFDAAALVDAINPENMTRNGNKVILVVEGNGFNTFLAWYGMVQVARTEREKTQVGDAINLRLIAMAMLIYADDHEGNFPPDLGTLVKDKGSKADVFLSPLTGHKPPDNWEKMELDERAKWINENSDYVYTAGGLKYGHSPGAILIYDKADLEKVGVNVLWIDLHVECIKPADIKAAFDKDKEARKNAQ